MPRRLLRTSRTQYGVRGWGAVWCHLWWGIWYILNYIHKVCSMVLQIHRRFVTRECLLSTQAQGIWSCSHRSKNSRCQNVLLTINNAIKPIFRHQESMKAVSGLCWNTYLVRVKSSCILVLSLWALFYELHIRGWLWLVCIWKCRLCFTYCINMRRYVEQVAHNLWKIVVSRLFIM